MAPSKTVLITGCSEGGIGFALAKEFQARGLHVFATARSPAKMAALEHLPNVTLLPLDVCSPASIAAAVAAVSAKTGGTLDFLVNNSGSQYVMPVLDVDLAQAKAMYEVNVWGVVAVTQAFAPLVIAARGSIANMASIAGLMYPPFMGKSRAAAGSQTDTQTLTLRAQASTRRPRRRCRPSARPSASSCSRSACASSPSSPARSRATSSPTRPSTTCPPAPATPAPRRRWPRAPPALTSTSTASARTSPAPSSPTLWVAPAARSTAARCRRWSSSSPRTCRPS